MLLLSLPGPAHPPLPCPLTCIASPAEDQAQGEEGNPWQGSPRRLFSPGPAQQATLPLAERPAQHLKSLGYNHARRRDEEIRKLHFCDSWLDVDIDYVS